MECLLHYVWKYKLYNAVDLVTTDGIFIQVIDTGMHNTDAGPDFFNAKIKVNHTVWAGSVEIHEKASDWLAHRHDQDKTYDAVILHVVGSNDAVIRRTTGEVIPQLILRIPESVSHNMHWLLHHDMTMPCLPHVQEIEQVHLSGWINALLQERLERKARDISGLLKLYNNDWNEVFYIMLTRSFGFGINSDAFEWLAKSLPLKYIQRQRSSCSQVEAMLFGQAGMLEEDGGDEYYRLLKREYGFLKQKYSLKPLDESLFRNLRTRPGNFPHIKLAQLAAIWCAHDTLFPVLREAGNLRQIREYLRASPSEYWQVHFRFNTPPSSFQHKGLSDNMLDILLINTVAPLFFAWGRKHGQPECTDKAIRILERIKAEKNSIVDLFVKAGIKVEHAGDSQALIQLRKCYCEQNKCLYCRIGFRLLKRDFFIPPSVRQDVKKE